MDSFPEVKRPSYNSQGMVARVSYSDRIVEGSLVEGRGVSSVASAESDCYSVVSFQRKHRLYFATNKKKSDSVV